MRIYMQIFYWPFKFTLIRWILIISKKIVSLTDWRSRTNVYLGALKFFLFTLKTYSDPDATGCSAKIVFFHTSLQPLPRLHRCKRPQKLSTQCECTVTPRLVIFCTDNSSRVLTRERWQTFENSWKKTQYLMNTL